MKLIKARIRGTGPVLKTSWFDLGAGLNIFQFDGQEEGGRLLDALETLHPYFDYEKRKVFDDLPHFEKVGNFSRHINPAKRTVAIGVFSSTPELVNKLGKISPLLYETDRIEIGRRMDYSQWSNFVELASSSRWSEISTDIDQVINLLKPSHPPLAQRFTDLVARLKPSDRIKSGIERKLLTLLSSLGSIEDSELQSYCNRIKTAALRTDHFQQARGVVYDNLPLLVRVHFSSEGLNTTSVKQLLNWLSVLPKNTLGDLQEINTELKSFSIHGSHIQLIKQDKGIDAIVEHRKSKQLLLGSELPYSTKDPIISIARAVSRAVFNAEPIFLADIASLNSRVGNSEDIYTTLVEISKNCQTVVACPTSLQLPQGRIDHTYHRNDLLA